MAASSYIYPFLGKLSKASLFTQSDPRHYQIVVLSLLLIYGIAALGFEVAWVHVAVIISIALLTQYCCTRLFMLPYFDPRSPLISALSLCLLLRTNYLSLMAVTAAISVLSKFIFRCKEKHIFNPTNFALVTMMLLTGQAWISPAQWGSGAFFAFLVACFGGLVIYRAARSDVTYAFLIFYIAILFGRALWLGDPMSIPLRQLQNGALLIFAFYMISDPRTVPNSRAGRILFAFLVAAGAGFVQFELYRTGGLLWSLAFFSIFVPFLDCLIPGQRYEWKKLNIKGASNEANFSPHGHPVEPIMDLSTRP